MKKIKDSKEDQLAANENEKKLIDEATKEKFECRKTEERCKLPLKRNQTREVTMDNPNSGLNFTNSEYGTYSEDSPRLNQVNKPEGLRKSLFHKKTLIFNLEHVFVHGVLKPIQNGDQPRLMEVNITVRPYTQEILQELSSFFKICVTSRKRENYCAQVLDKIDPNKYVSQRLFHENGRGAVSSSFYAELTDTDPKNLIIVGTQLNYFTSGIDNVVPIIPFVGCLEDDQLKKLKWFLLSLSELPDVRPSINHKFPWEKWVKKLSADD